MNWKGCERKRPLQILRHFPGICQEGPRKIAKTLSRISRIFEAGTSRIRNMSANQSTATFGKAFLNKENDWPKLQHPKLTSLRWACQRARKQKAQVIACLVCIKPRLHDASLVARVKSRGSARRRFMQFLGSSTY
jgi:hypothetical protein